MARIRTIKPEFFTSEDIVELTPLARLLYIGIWCEADKEGRLQWKPRTLKIRYLPGDNCDIDALCGELVDADLVRLYGDCLAYVPGFTKHQHVNPRETPSKLPLPPDCAPSQPKKIGKTLRDEVVERDGGRCVRCGSDDHIQIDHILPQSCGGPHVAENLRVLCRACNAGRPVSGDALRDDLKRDGFDYDELRAKFGIDASIPDLHAQGGREGKGKEENTNPQAPLPSESPEPAAASVGQDDIDKIRMAVWRQSGLTEDQIVTKLVSMSGEGIRQARTWLECHSLDDILAAIAEAYDGAEKRGEAIRKPWAYLGTVVAGIAEKKAQEAATPVVRDKWKDRRALFESGAWPTPWGPPPGQSGCEAPQWVQDAYAEAKKGKAA